MQSASVENEPDEFKKAAHIDVIERERKRNCDQGYRKHLLKNLNHHRVEHDLFLNNLKINSTYNNVQSNLEQEEKLAIELQKQNRKEIVDIKTRQRLRETDLQLRELESKLKKAYVTKELFAQKAEKEYYKLLQKQKDRETCEVFKKALNEDKIALQIEKEEDFKRKMEYKKDLQDQIILKYQKQQQQYEEFLKEKKLLDDVIQRIHDEDEREIIDKMCKMQKTKQEIDAFKESQKIWREKERKELEEENRRIVQHLKEKELKARAEAEHKQQTQAAKDAIKLELCKQIYKEELKRKEREEILQEFAEEEKKEVERQKLKKEFEREIQKRIEMKNTLYRQLEEQEQKIKQAELEDMQYREQMLKKIREDEKIEQLSADKKRIKMIQMRRETEETIKERRAKRAEELKTIIHLQEQEKIREDEKEKIIKDERLKLLKEHATNLIGFLPPGILRADDLPHLGPEFVKYYSSK